MALLTLMCGFLAATISNVTVDAATGYATTEIGPNPTTFAPGRAAIHVIAERPRTRAQPVAPAATETPSRFRSEG
jgi:hypothetical protein